jgi:pyridinium-3,5-bisthiocarboxylic acid mononucleotide nickel chelatase
VIRVAYFDCFSGCSGDMLLGALLDAGLPLEILQNALSGLDISGYRLSVEKVRRCSIAATKFNVTMDTEVHQHHRGLTEILTIISSGRLPAAVKEKSTAVFRRLGEVEARVHGIPLEEVHFHELGAIDTIIDIVGTIYALDYLKIARCYSSPLPAGSGRISAAHGILPAPAPATLQILAEAGAPLTAAPDPSVPPGELVTPTGAVLVASLAGFRRPDMTLEKIGYGAGSKEFERWPNVLRVWLGEESDDNGGEGLVLLETNIDDMSPQVYGYLMEKLLAKKAADVWFTPVQMKKNRPAVMLSVLGPASLEDQLTAIIMRETSTLGIRSRRISRHIAQREIIEFESSLGHVRAKVKRFGTDIVEVSPEYEDCRRIAEESGRPLQAVLRTIEAEARNHLST